MRVSVDLGPGQDRPVVQYLETARDPVLRRPWQHRFQGAKVERIGVAARRELHVFHGRQRNADEQLELAGVRPDKGLDVDDFGNGTICRMD